MKIIVEHETDQHSHDGGKVKTSNSRAAGSGAEKLLDMARRSRNHSAVVEIQHPPQDNRSPTLLGRATRGKATSRVVRAAMWRLHNEARHGVVYIHRLELGKRTRNIDVL